MGFSFALHWAQPAHLSILSRLQAPGSVRQLFDLHPALSLKEAVGQIIYVDNGIYVSSVPGLSSSARRASQAALQSCSLPVHKQSRNLIASRRWACSLRVTGSE